MSRILPVETTAEYVMEKAMRAENIPTTGITADAGNVA